MSDISKSDLNGIERQLDRIVDKLSGSAHSYDRTDQIISLLKEISRKLDSR